MKQASTRWGNEINWNHVFYFSEVAACGSIKDAAPKLNLSPSTLSTHISQLEKNLEVQLFHRHHRRISLTSQGVKLFQYAKQMFEAGKRLIDVVSPVSLGDYPISIGLVPCPSMQLGYQVVANYLTSYDSVNIRVSQTRQEELEKGLAEARFDFGFSGKISGRKEIAHQIVTSSPLHFYVSHENAKEKFTDLITRLPVVICSTESSGLNLLNQLLEQTELTPKSVVTADYPGLVFKLCAKGCAIGVFGDESLKKTGIDAPHHLTIPKGAPTITDNLYVLWSKDSDNSQAVRHLKMLLMKSEEEIRRKRVKNPL
ncbi:LysR family transcriptional regulator [Bdellovibrionota bacterium FG-2]